uniref:(S)-ureidoglycine aminohydrolase cupin domain-containing protein n=1 Tax=Candidatus Kentrum sp. LFY TaxID=2126342 RepID=A0A450UYB6_9GAMM|nr:MAG: hypothetical protein BECKLFY1418B_GA0070995_10219 [Candidatus Kentron sp. LFY]VFJ97528.1 MAG: hypothetical protein BECKLFY1418A_GA0070994_107020 [Candidatus Kentron sp. LFY]VFK21591.1 MAG: hypothetical protein BECKLFY1418C_GA0070996_10973 [Candidatus Kentron sp. LFY]
MSEIMIEHNPAPDRLDTLGVYDWPTWEKETSKFAWNYDSNETCYVLEGEFTVTPDGGEPVHVKAGDLVRFPAGMSCTWEVHQPVRKHFSFR